MRGFRHWRWPLYERCVKLNGETLYLWPAVDHEGEVLESYLTKTRDKGASFRFPREGAEAPRQACSDHYGQIALLRCSDGCARRSREAGDGPLGRERAMRFRQMKTLQKFASAHAN
jgi:putative transposase